jgi:hypothetical protein
VNFLVILAVDARSWVWRNLFLSGKTIVSSRWALLANKRKKAIIGP